MKKVSDIIASEFLSSCVNRKPFRFSELVSRIISVLSAEGEHHANASSTAKDVLLEVKNRQRTNFSHIHLSQLNMFHADSIPVVSIDLYPLGLATRPGTRMNPFLTNLAEVQKAKRWKSKCRAHGIWRHIENYLHENAHHIVSTNETVWNFVLRTRRLN